MDEFLIYGEPIKGWSLIRAMVDVANMKAGEWGLAFSELFFKQKNFLASFVFKDIPTELNLNDYDGYISEIEEFERRMVTDPQVGFAFYSSCINDGFKMDADDFHLFTAGRILQTAKDGQDQLNKEQLQILMDIFVEKEEYEKAALVRDTLEDKLVLKVF